MNLPRIIPCLLLQGTGLIKTVEFKNPKYVGDAINAVRIFNEKEVDELILLDVQATIQKREPRFDYILDIGSECFMPFAYGGGVTSLQQMERILRAGAEKIVFNTAAFTHPSLISEAARVFGSQSVVVAMDVKRTFLGGYDVFSHCGRQARRVDPVAHARRSEALGAGEVFLQSMDLDGTGKGYDLELVRKISAAVGIPVIASGGAGTVSHFREAIEAGASAAAAGSCFVFHGKHRAVLITYPGRDELERAFLRDARSEK